MIFFSFFATWMNGEAASALLMDMFIELVKTYIDGYINFLNTVFF